MIVVIFHRVAEEPSDVVGTRSLPDCVLPPEVKRSLDGNFRRRSTLAERLNMNAVDDVGPGAESAVEPFLMSLKPVALCRFGSSARRIIAC